MTYRPIERFEPVETVQPWGTETLIAEGPGYTGKLLFYKAGHAGGFQYHVEKDETFYLHRGRALVESVRDGLVHAVKMYACQSCHIPAGAPHKFTALTDCVVFEASTPHRNDRVNVAEELTGIPDPEGTLPSTWLRSADGTHRRVLPAYKSDHVLTPEELEVVRDKFYREHTNV